MTILFFEMRQFSEIFSNLPNIIKKACKRQSLDSNILSSTSLVFFTVYQSSLWLKLSEKYSIQWDIENYLIDFITIFPKCKWWWVDCRRISVLSDFIYVKSRQQIICRYTLNKALLESNWLLAIHLTMYFYLNKVVLIF